MCAKHRSGGIRTHLPLGNRRPPWKILRMPQPAAAFRRLIHEIGTVDQIGVEERVAKFTTRSIKRKSKVFGLKLAVSMVDLTTLEGKDTPGKVASLCRKAMTPHDDPDIPAVAAVCVYSSMVRPARRHL